MATATATRKPVVEANPSDLDFRKWSAQKLVQFIQEVDDDNAAIKARVSDEDNPPSEEECEHLEAELDANEVLKGSASEFLNAAQARVAAFKARIPEAPTRTVNRPNLGGQSAPGTGTTTPDTKAESTGTFDLVESEDDKFLKRGPFKGLAHFCHAVKRAGDRPGLWMHGGPLGEWNSRVRGVSDAIKAMDPETKALSGLGELTDDEGAAFVPTQIAAGIYERSKEMIDLMALADRTPVAGNSLTVKAWQDKNATAGYFGGAVAYWGAEAAQKIPSKPKTRDINLKLNKLYALFYASDELLEDAPALESELTKVAAYALVRKRNEAVIRGTGVGMPLGILNSAAKITQAAVSGQGANTIVAQNIDEMWARRAPDSADRCVWLYIIDAEPQFARANYSIANTAATWVYVPAGGLSARMYDTLKGRRCIETAHASALGTEGDIILWDPMSYKVIEKTSGVNRATSIHLRFDYDETAFRWVQRVDGQPLWDAPFTPEHGNTRSPIVTLSSSRT